MTATALSVKEPWAWLIVNGMKPVENRNWWTSFRGHVLIHAGKTMTKEDYSACVLFIAGVPRQTPWRLPAYDILRNKWCGGIIGSAKIVDCVTESDSPWFCGDYGFVMTEQKVLPFRRCRGALGFFKVEYPPL